MKKNIYLIIITIITVVCIIAGSLYHIGGFALGLFNNLIPRSDKSLGNVCTEELSVDEFSNLVFDTTISNINVKTGDGYMMDLDSGTGDITINGNDYDDEYEVNEHAKKHLVIDSGLGDIEVKY